MNMGSSQKAEPRPGPGQINQRLAKYMVTSKPMRRSVKAGLVHMVRFLFLWMAGYPDDSLSTLFRQKQNGTLEGDSALPW
ncbi:hypothetical protein L686_10975 [Stutzerimonas stutzeri MF28]|jgi:hypothetical protein|nr:hypothetical protein L686_10975 [Stutzerimonas stutzeri MF28]